MYSIREIENQEPLDSSVEIIRKSFATVAEDLGLTEENTPSHPSFMTVERLEESRNRGLVFFGLFEDEDQAGFVAVEDVGEGTFYIERLAVLSDHRHNGYGLKLVRHALGYAKNSGGRKVSIAIIDEQTILKNWYKQMGFAETGTKKFDHLPFTVGFLEIDLKKTTW